MTLDPTFVEAAMRTNSDLTGSFQISPDVIHAVLGIVTEVEEFAHSIIQKDVTNMVEEYGDALWFAALYNHATGATVDLELDTDDFNRRPEESVAVMLDSLKAAFAYGRSKLYSKEELINGIIPEQISHILRLMGVAVANGTRRTYPEVIEKAQAAVIAKLKARYPEKFSQRAATERNLENEREVLDGITRY